MVKIIKTYYSFLLLLSKILYNNLRNIGRYIVILSCLTVYLSPYLVEAQPKSFTTESNLTPSQNIPSFFLKVVNHDSLSRADDTLGYENRFGIGQTFNSSLYDIGIWDTLPEGRILRVRIVSPGAISHAFLFSDFHLSDKAELYVIEENTAYYKGPYTYRNNKPYNRHTIGSTFGSSHILELYEPFEEFGGNTLLLATIYQGYRYISIPENVVNGKEEQILRRFGASNTTSDPNCNPNVNCPYGDDWCKEKYAVCLLEMPFGSSYQYCTGTLINNTANDFRPFVLSAWHCANRGNNCDLDNGDINSIQDWVFVFNWWSNTSPNCANHGSEVQALANINGKEYSGGDFRAGFRDTDMLLVEIKTTNNGGEFDPVPIKGFYYAGWSRSTLLPQQATLLHHPNGDIMKYASCNDTTGIQPQGAGHDCSDGLLDNIRPITSNYWEIKFDIGHTEGGSSGSAVFDQNHLIRGILSSHTDNRSCNRALRRETWFGKFDVSWNGGGSSDSRLKDWLDPISSNQLSHEGIYSTIQLYNRYTEEDEQQLEISIIPDGVAYYHAPTEIHLGGGKSWTPPPPYGARNNHSFQFHEDYGGDVSTAKRIVLKECLWVPERIGINQKVRFHIGTPQCTIGESAVEPNNPPVRICMESDVNYSQGTSCDRTTSMAPHEPIERRVQQSHINSSIPKLLLTPNPAFDYVDIRIEGQHRGHILFINSLGLTMDIISSKISESENITVTRYDLREIPSGMYSVTTQSGGQLLTQPLMIIR